MKKGIYFGQAVQLYELKGLFIPINLPENEVAINLVGLTIADTERLKGVLYTYDGVTLYFPTQEELSKLKVIGSGVAYFEDKVFTLINYRPSTLKLHFWLQRAATQKTNPHYYLPQELFIGRKRGFAWNTTPEGHDFWQSFVETEELKSSEMEVLQVNGLTKDPFFIYSEDNKKTIVI